MVLTIAIVSYNTSKILESCLNSVFNVLNNDGFIHDAEVIIVDNGSSDGSPKMVKEKFPKARMILNKKNLGFAKANNQAIKLSASEFVLLLNSDAKLTNGSLSKLLTTLKTHPEIGAIGPKLLNSDHSIQPSCGFLPNLFKVLVWMLFLDDIPILQNFLNPYHIENTRFYNNSHFVDWVSGACMLIRRKAFDKAGLLDEKIFMYGEEVELCIRIRSSGYRIFYLESACVYHLKGASGKGEQSGITEEFAALKYIYKKHKPLWQQVSLSLLLKLGALLRIVLFGIIWGSPKSKSLYAKAFEVA